MENTSPDGKYREWFDREHLRKDIKGKSIKGGASTVSAQVFAFALSIGSNIIMARLLLPSDYGLVKMVTAITGFVLIFKDLGLSQAIVQSPQVNHTNVSKTFWLNFYVSLALTLIIVLIAPLLVNFYDEPQLFNITLAFSTMALISGLSVQHTALLTRQMQFRKLANIKIFSAVFGVVIGIGMALLKFGYWSIIGLNIATALANTVFVWIYCNWRPMFSKVDRSIKNFAKFGADMTGYSIINYFSRNLDNILIGKFVGDVALGFYDRAYQLLMVPITQLRDPLNSVGIPALSSMKPDSIEFSRYYYRYLFLMAFFSMPLVAFMGIASKPIIFVLLGEKWLPSADLFSLLAIVAFIQPVASTRGMIMISAGHSRKILYWGLINSSITIGAFLIGIFAGGMRGLIIGYIFSGYLLLIPSLIYGFKGTSVTLRGFFNQIVFSVLFTGLATLTGWTLMYVCEGVHPLLLIFIVLTGFSATYIVSWVVLPVSRNQFAIVGEIIRYLFKEIKKRRAK